MALGVERWPEFNAYCLRGGVDVLRQPLHNLLDLAYAFGVEGATEKDRTRWVDELYMPPDTVDPDEAEGWSDEELLDGFQSALRSQQAQHAERQATRVG